VAAVSPHPPPIPSAPPPRFYQADLIHTITEGVNRFNHHPRPPRTMRVALYPYSPMSSPPDQTLPYLFVPPARQTSPGITEPHACDTFRLLRTPVSFCQKLSITLTGKWKRSVSLTPLRSSASYLDRYPHHPALSPGRTTIRSFQNAQTDARWPHLTRRRRPPSCRPVSPCAFLAEGFADTPMSPERTYPGSSGCGWP
jgi:hypothetical protein